jgi:acetolactate synthase I/II/III large subunit
MENNQTIKMTGGEAIGKMLGLYGSRYMFGMGGFQLLPLYDSICRSGNEMPRHIHVNDERSGAFAADAYARVSGSPGICDGTLGPGATNLVTGLVESLTAGIPLVAFTGDSNRDHSGKHMTQETPNQAELLSLISKKLIRVERGYRIPELIRHGFITATSGRPGPAILSIPENVAHGEWDYQDDDFFADETSSHVGSRRVRPDAKQLRKAASLIEKSKRPILLAGGGVHLSQAYDEVGDFARRLNIPVAHTLSGKGVMAGGDPKCLGLFGRFDRVANDFIKQSDLIIAAGFKFGEIATIRYSLIPDNVDIIHIDIVPEEIGRHQKVTVGLWADCKSALEDLLQELGDGEDAQRMLRQDYIKEVTFNKNEWGKINLDKLKSDEKPINIGRLCYDLTQVMPEDGILVADGGFAAHWTGLLYDPPHSGRNFVANRGNASIGYGLPGGIGAKLAAGSSPVMALTGDVGFNMSMGELETAIREKIPLVLIIVNNAASGYFKSLQHSMFQGRHQSSDLHEIDYSKIADVMGCQGIRVNEPQDLQDALRDAMTEKSLPVVVDVVVTRDPARMLPAIDARTVSKTKKGDRLI